MTAASMLQLGLLVAALAVSTPLLGRYIATVFATGPDRPRPPLDRLFRPVERLVFRVCGVDAESEQPWPAYARAVLAFSVVSVLFLYLLQRLQGLLPLNPTHAPAVRPYLALNTAVSFVTNTNWQSYSGETAMAYLTQAVGLAVANFVSAAVGLAVAVALVRGLVRRRSGTIGNFWVDLVHGCVRVLLPLAFLASLVLVAAAVPQNTRGFVTARTVEGARQQVPGGPVASQEAIKHLGTNGGGFYNANSAHPFENPSGFTNLFEVWLLLCIPFALPVTFGRLVGDTKQGLAVLTAMVVLWVVPALLTAHFEQGGNAALDERRHVLATVNVEQQRTATQAGGNAEGKEVRLGPQASGLFASSATGTSTGAADSALDSYTPIGGMLPLFNMMLGEVSPGGVGSGLYGMLVFALLAVFIAGLMVGRTPEYLGKKIEVAEMKLVVVYILVVPLVVLALSSVSVLMGQAKSSIANPGPHGLTEVVYAYTSTANNNGSAFAGLRTSTDWYDITLGLAMLIGRFMLLVPVLAVAGSLARKPATPVTAGTFPTNTPTFAFLLVAVTLIVVGLTYFPVLSLGPIVEQLSLP